MIFKTPFLLDLTWVRETKQEMGITDIILRTFDVTKVVSMNPRTCQVLT